MTARICLSTSSAPGCAVFSAFLPAAVMRGVLQGYDRRYNRLVDWVAETEGGFSDDLLGELPA